ncbi:MAG TPA: hypothetical protein VK974_04605 [Methylophilaceae bacterium]|nr:hypothetical protein [Methylophilaceae bacterium]
MKPELLLELLKEVEQEDPIDFSGLPFDEQDLRQLACLNVAEIVNNWPQDTAQNDKDMLMAATVVRLVLENMVLHARLAILIQEPEG